MTTASEETRGSSRCPICGHDQPHGHETKEIDRWLKAQATRWDYVARVYPRRLLAGTEDEDAREQEDWMLDSIEHTLSNIDKEADSVRRGYGFVFDEIYDIRDVMLALRERLGELARENVALAVKVRDLESTLRNIQ
jgi:hypothetical protein